MKLEYDREADAAYVYFVYPIKAGQAKNTVTMNESINLDFDINGKLLGIEILAASKVLSREALMSTGQFQ